MIQQISTTAINPTFNFETVKPKPSTQTQKRISRLITLFVEPKAKYLDVYVDEAGDLGFSERATKFFVVAFLACDTSINTRTEMKRALKRLHERRKYPYSNDELKFSKMNGYCREYVLKKVAQSGSHLGVVVVQKDRVAKKLREDLTVLYNWLVVHNIMSALHPLLETTQKMNVFFDKSLSKKRIASFNEYVKEKTSYLSYAKGSNLPYDCVAAYHVDSRVEPCLQAVDAIAGAYFQLYEHQNAAYVAIIKDKISSFTYLWK
jgi:hypothetical protein